MLTLLQKQKGRGTEHRFSTPQEVSVLSYSLSQVHTTIQTVRLDYPGDGGSSLLRNAGSYFLVTHPASHPESLKSSTLQIMNYEKVKQRNLHSKQQQKCRPPNAHYWNKGVPMLNALIKHQSMKMNTGVAVRFTHS